MLTELELLMIIMKMLDNLKIEDMTITIIKELNLLYYKVIHPKN